MTITPLDAWISGKLGTPGGRLTREALDAYALEALRETIRHARMRSRFYARRLEGIGERDLESLEDLARFPFTTPDELRADPMGFLCLSGGEIARVVTLPTSGTTGEPKRLHFTREDLEATADFFHHGITTLAGPGDVVLSVLPGGRPGGVNDLLALAVERAGARWVPPGSEREARAWIAIMARERVSVLVGAPVQVLALTRCGAGSSSVPRAVLLSTDSLPRSIVRELERAWGCEVFEHYGMTEMGYGGVLECGAHFGCHPREFDLYFEVVHPESGRPLPDGETGEVVFTTLTRRGMPLIRYRTGDLAPMLAGPCPCGSALRRLGRVSGRVGSSATLPGGGTLALADLDEALFGLEGLTDFRAELILDAATWRLRIDLTVTDLAPPGVSALARERIEAIPFIGSEPASGRVVFDVRVAGEEAPFARGGGKRILTVRRNGSGGNS